MHDSLFLKKTENTFELKEGAMWGKIAKNEEGEINPKLENAKPNLEKGGWKFLKRSWR